MLNKNKIRGQRVLDLLLLSHVLSLHQVTTDLNIYQHQMGDRKHRVSASQWLPIFCRLLVSFKLGMLFPK